MWAWSEIQASLGRGTTMQEIWQALCRDGIEMSYGQFRTYIWRIRKRLAAGSVGVAGSPVRMPEIVGQPDASEAFATPGPTPQNRPADPLANIRREVERKRTSGFQYDPFPDVVATGAELATTPETPLLMRAEQPESWIRGRTCAGTSKQAGLSLPSCRTRR
jgi:hypothetical protein